MKIKYITLGSLLTLGLLLISLLSGYALAQEPEPDTPSRPLSPDVPAASSNFIPIQGRLTDASGNPLNGVLDLTLRMYSSYTGGTALCEDVSGTTTVDGLFIAYMDARGCPIDGRQLYLSIQVNDDPEMSPRQFITNVPYAWSLRPGAVISGTINNSAIMHIENWGASGRGLRVYAMDQTSTNYGIVGASRSPNGYGGYFYNNGGGVGLYASSSAASSPGLLAKGMDSGPDIILGGNADTNAGDDGILKSDPTYASSDIVLKSNDTVRIDLDNDGDGEDADFEIRNKDDTLLFDVDDSGAVIYGGPGVAAFPRPAYDSGWVTILAGNSNSLVLTHNLGGSVDNYIVDLSFKHPSYGVHQFGYGGDVTSGGFYGSWWRNLTTSSITIERATNDTDCPQVRVRIWVYP
jgi:hypothetical protein